MSSKKIVVSLNPARWKIGEWGECQQCGTGVQFRQVQCIIPASEPKSGGRAGIEVETGELVTSPVLVVEDLQCGSERPPGVQTCHKVCPAGMHSAFLPSFNL